MKIRTDFVSNSSSCSFIIKDVGGFIDAFERDGVQNGRDFWSLEDVVNFRVSCKERDAAELEMAIRGKRYTFREYEDWDHARKWGRTLDDDHWIEVTLDQLLDCPRELLPKINRLEFECGNNGYTEKNVIGIFYKYCEAVGLSPSAEETDSYFLDTPIFKMINAIVKNEVAKK